MSGGRSILIRVEEGRLRARGLTYLAPAVGQPLAGGAGLTSLNNTLRDVGAVWGRRTLSV